MSVASLIIGLLLVSSQVEAQHKPRKQIIPNTVVRHKMNNISGVIRTLGPYIASENEFTKDKNKPIIQKNLEELTALFKNLKTHPVISTHGLSLTQEVMTDQLEQTVSLFKTDKRSHARAKFNAALNLCVSCHTQSPGVGLSKLFADTDIRKMKASNFEKAELYFISRDYDKAMALYDQLLMKSKKTDDDEFLFKALERQLIYFIRIKRSFPEAKANFDKYIKANILNKKLTEEVKDWLVALEGKSLWDTFNPENVKDEEMAKFMSTFIADNDEGPIFTVTNSSEVYDLNLYTILTDYYNAHPDTTLGARILYWLAILDKRINEDLFFSLGDYYLISCMEKYSKDPVAHDCYDAYQEDLEINYLTKDNKDKKEFSPEVIQRLNNLKKLINYQDKGK